MVRSSLLPSSSIPAAPPPPLLPGRPRRPSGAGPVLGVVEGGGEDADEAVEQHNGREAQVRDERRQQPPAHTRTRPISAAVIAFPR